jgi:hypothetical protein
MTAGGLERFADSKIVRVLERAGVELRRQGARLVALCVFHDERSPSMTVNAALDAVHCFGCGAAAGYVDLARHLDVDLDAALGPMSRNAPAPAPRPRVPMAQPPRLPRADVLSLWSECRPVTSDAGVAAWLRGRGFDPALVEDRDLCRALPPALALPLWARFEGASWTERPEQFRAIFPMYGAGGALEGLRARALHPSGKLKALAPVGGGPSGLVLTDDLGRRLLTGDVAALADVAACAPQPGLVIAEGEPDFVAWATNWGDAAERYPAIWGIVAGSWTAGHAARVPTGTTVTIATHHDTAGDKYAREITETLAGRARLLRWRHHGA